MLILIYMEKQNNKHERNELKEQSQLRATWQWAEKILQKNKSEDKDYVSVSTGSVEDFEAGLFPVMQLEQKGSEIKIQIDTTRYGKGIPNELRSMLQEFTLAERNDGSGYMLAASDQKSSRGEAVLLDANATEEGVLGAFKQDEQELFDSMHPASPEEIDRLADLMEMATLGEDYYALASFDDLDIEMAIKKWQEEIDQKIHSENDSDSSEILPEKANSLRKYGHKIFEIFRRHKKNDQ